MRIIIFEYQDGIDFENKELLNTAISRIIFLGKNKKINLFLPKKDNIALKIAKEFNTLTNIGKIEITTDLKKNTDFQKTIKDKTNIAILIFKSGSIFFDFLKEKIDPTKKTECVFGQVGSIKIISLKKGSLTY